MLTKLGHHAPAILAFAGITTILTWPLAWHLADAVPHDLGDPLVSTWVLWWNARVMPFSAEWWNGPIFFPARDTLTFSDHRVGLSLITSPLIWVGFSPLAAYNVSFLLTFILSAIAAYALCFTLTRHRFASFAGGLVFGFHPYRADHLPHLELLAAYWLPIVLLTLHKWLETKRTFWLVWLSLALALQGLTCGYYFCFAGVLLMLWIVWFVPFGLPRRQYASLVMALALPLVVLAPILFKYRLAHLELGLSRSIVEIDALSADVIGLLTAPDSLALWNSPTSWQKAEGALMPGLTAVIVVVLAILTRQTVARRDLPAGWRLARLVCLAGAVVAAAVALIPATLGPIAFHVAGLRVSISAAYKPLSISALLCVFWILTSRPVRDAWRTQSVLGFYVLATLAMWVFALGPTARLLGHRILYKAPYSWLMILPAFRDEFRVPARFALLAALTLSVAVGFALAHLLRRYSTALQVRLATVACVGILLDSWIRPFTLVRPPQPLDVPSGVPQQAAILELPVGTFDDAAAMFRGTIHERPVVNGMSGYGAPHVYILQLALKEGAVEALTALARDRDLAVFLSRESQDTWLIPLIQARTNAVLISDTATHAVFVIPRTAAESHVSARTSAPRIPLQRLAATENEETLKLMTDGDPRSAWLTDGPQRGDEELTTDLGDVFEVTGIDLALGAHPGTYPRSFVVDVSPDQKSWTEAWRGDGAAPAMVAAIETPRDVRISIDFPPTRARFVRIKQIGRSRANPWGVAELGIIGNRAH